MSVVSYTRQLNKQVGAECFSTRRPAANQVSAGQRREYYRIQIWPVATRRRVFFVLITKQEVLYERHDQEAEESEDDDLGGTCRCANRWRC